MDGTDVRENTHGDWLCSVGLREVSVPACLGFLQQERNSEWMP